jgi:transposase
MPCSLGLRKRGIDSVEGGGSISKAVRTYLVGHATIYHGLHRVDLAPTKVTRRKRKLDHLKVLLWLTPSSALFVYLHIGLVYSGF